MSRPTNPPEAVDWDNVYLAGHDALRSGTSMLHAARAMLQAYDRQRTATPPGTPAGDVDAIRRALHAKRTEPEPAPALGECRTCHRRGPENHDPLCARVQTLEATVRERCARITKIEQQLAAAQKQAEQNWNAYCGAEARRKAASERERAVQEHRKRAESELATQGKALTDEVEARLKAESERDEAREQSLRRYNDHCGLSRV